MVPPPYPQVFTAHRKQADERSSVEIDTSLPTHEGVNRGAGPIRPRPWQWTLLASTRVPLLRRHLRPGGAEQTGDTNWSSWHAGLPYPRRRAFGLPYSRSYHPSQTAP